MEWESWGRGSAQEESSEVGRAANAQTSSASEPQEGAREQGLRGLRKFSYESQLYSLYCSAWASLSEAATDLIVCGADGGLLTSGGKLLHRAQARVGPREVSQWAQ